MRDDISDRIMRSRISAKYTKVAAARALGVAASSYAAWEIDRKKPTATRPTIDHCASLAILYGVSLEWLIMGAGKPTVGISLRTMDHQTVEIVQALSEASSHQRAAILNAIQVITAPY